MSLKQQRALILFDVGSVWRSAVQRYFFRIFIEKKPLKDSLKVKERFLSFFVCSSLDEVSQRIQDNPHSFIFFSLDHCFQQNKISFVPPEIKNDLLSDSVKFLQTLCYSYSELKFAILCKTLSQLTRQVKNEFSWFFMRQQAVAVCHTEREIPKLLQFVAQHERQFPDLEQNITALLEKNLPWQTSMEWPIYLNQVENKLKSVENPGSFNTEARQ